MNHESSRLQQKTSTTRPFFIIDNHNAYYPDPDYGINPYWDVHLFKQHHLSFENNCDRLDNQTEPDSHEIDDTLNSILSNALVDQWQSTKWPHLFPSSKKPENELQRKGPEVSLTAAVGVVRFVNMLVTRTWLFTADNQPCTQIQAANALFSNRLWRTNIRWPC